MPPIIEVGHAKNVANLADLISFCASFGPAYNPTKTSITIAALNTLQTNAQAAINNVNVQNTFYNNTVNDRMLVFKPLKTLATRIIAALQATDATTLVIKDAITINKKIQGRRATPITAPVDPNAPAPATISTAQLSYDQLIQHFERLILLLQSETSYNPNEADLSTTSLLALQADFILKNQNVTNAYTQIANARINRDQILYAASTGLIDTTLDVKQYVKSIFGASSPQYKQIVAIKFTKRKP